VPAKQQAGSLEITSSRMGRLLDVLAAAYRQLGFDEASGGDAVFEQLVTARIIEPTSKQDAARVLAEAGVRALSYRTVKRRLPRYARQEWRDRLSVTIDGSTRSINRDLEAKVRALAGWKPYITNLDADPSWVIGAYHQLWRIEHAFRMSKHDLRARPIYHHKRESIDAHLAVVFTALAVSHWIEGQTGQTIKKLVRTLRRYRTVQINTGSHILTAEDPLPDDLRRALAAIHTDPAH
jgi:Transposase DDE domain